MPTEGLEKGKIYFKNQDDDEYKELKFTDSELTLEENKELETVKRTCDPDGEFEFEIRNKNAIRKIRQMLKTDKEKKAELRQNKENFRKFIKKRGEKNKRK